MKIDWQAYLDGSLNESERAAADQLLLSDSSARRELDGLQNFVSTIRNVGQAEEIPLARLTALLPEAKKKSSPAWFRQVGWLAGAAAAAVIAVLLISPPIPAKGSRNSELYTSSPATATTWAIDKLKMDLPIMDLGSDAELFYVHEGKGKCCFDYKVHGDTYHVNVRPDNRGIALEGRQIKLRTGVPAGVDRGVRWREKKMEFFIVGPNPNVSVDLANRTSDLVFQRI